MASPPRTRQRDDDAALNTSHHSSRCTNPPSPDSNDNLDECYLGEWSDDELDILEDGLARYASEESIIKRYEKIATHLPNKTTRDVALRCRLISKKESSKRNKDNKESASNSSGTPFIFTAQPNASCSHTNTADGISHSASSGGLTEQLLAQNVLALSLISSNLSTMQAQANVSQDNIDLLCQTRNNIVSLVSRLRNDPKPMPPSPFTLNEEHASTSIPSPDPSISNPDLSRISSNSRTGTSNPDPSRSSRNSRSSSSSNSREKTARRRRK